MQLIKQLYSDIPPNVLKSYDSHIHLHLKELLTLMSKQRLQDLSTCHLRTKQCYLTCYRYYAPLENTNKLERTRIMDQITQLRTCKQKCGNEVKAVEGFLNDINFYAKNKIEKSSRACEQQYKQTYGVTSQKQKLFNVQYNQCMWKALNKIDRRFKKYWKQKRQNVQAQFNTN